MMSAMNTLWSRSLAISLGSPEVVARRVALMTSPAGWSPAGANEMQSMMIEKIEAALEAFGALCRGIVSTPWVGDWFAPAGAMLRTANQMVQPLSDRVEANVDRLRDVAA